MNFSDIDQQFSALSQLFDPVRRSLYLYVASRPRGNEDVGRDEAAKAVSINRSLAAFHLDKLAGNGLLEVSYRRTSGRSGPGAGRPAKFYRRAERSFEITFPSRRYDLAARILATALAERAGRSSRGESSPSSVEAAARKLGTQIGAAARSLLSRTSGKAPRKARQDMMDVLSSLLSSYGFDPIRPDPDVIHLGNCPFESLAGEFPLLVCGMNHAFMDGILKGVGVHDLSAQLEPTLGRCCVTFRLAALNKN